MLTVDGDEMSLSANAELVCADLVALGAVATSGHRSVAGQARAMAVNVCKVTVGPDGESVQHRDFIGKTYLHGAALQALVDAHPEWETAAQVGDGLYKAMVHDGTANDVEISHHLKIPCDVFDLKPASVNEAVRTRIEAYQREGVIVRVLWREGGLKKCHIEVALLPDNKVTQV